MRANRRTRAADRIERRDGGYHTRVRAGFLAEPNADPIASEYRR